jgi:hypothetical protein
VIILEIIKHKLGITIMNIKEKIHEILMELNRGRIVGEKKPQDRKKKTCGGISIYCRKCKNDLCSDDSFISDTYDDDGNNHVKYKCKKCGTEADFNFDFFLVPINWKDIRNAKNNVS